MPDSRIDCMHCREPLFTVKDNGDGTVNVLSHGASIRLQTGAPIIDMMCPKCGGVSPKHQDVLPPAFSGRA